MPTVFYKLILERQLVFTLLQMEGLLGGHILRCH